MDGALLRNRYAMEVEVMKEFAVDRPQIVSFLYHSIHMMTDKKPLVLIEIK